MRFLVALILSMLAANVARAGIVVWMSEEVPDDRVTSKSDNKTGGTDHKAYFDLAYPPQPAGKADEDAWEALRKAVADGKKRWNEFEVEYPIAMDIDEKIAAIDVIRSDRDLDELVEALLFQGAAVAVAFEPDEFVDGKRAKPFRFARTGGAGNRPWADAYALMPDREPVGSDVADGATYPSLLAEYQLFESRKKGTLKLAKTDGKIILDGREVEAGTESVELPAGRHYIHVVRDGKISGRQVIQVEEGRTAEMTPRITVEDMKAAEARIIEGTTTGFPENLRAAMEITAGHYGGQVFVGTEDKGGVVLPYAYGASLLKQRPVTFVGVGEIGGGLMSTKLFDKAIDKGEQLIAPMTQGSLGFEIGIYNFAVVGGTSLAMTPGNTITHAKGDSTTENVDTSVFVQPYVGAGGYIFRPTGRTPTALVQAHYTWLHPAHHAVGGQFSLGFPFEPEGGTWIRMTIGGNGFPKSMWDEGSERTSVVMMYARGGVAARF